MEILIALATPYLPAIIIAVLGGMIIIYGVTTFLLDIRSAYSLLRGWFKKRSEFHRSVESLRAQEYFIAHIIHLGGEFSMTYSMFVYSNEDGGYYFNPANEFVSVGFNRGGDQMVVTPTRLSSTAGFLIHSATSTTDTPFHVDETGEICHLSIPQIKNEYTVTFRMRTKVAKKSF